MRELAPSPKVNSVTMVAKTRARRRGFRRSSPPRRLRARSSTRRWRPSPPRAGPEEAQVQRKAQLFARGNAQHQALFQQRGVEVDDGMIGLRIELPDHVGEAASSFRPATCAGMTRRSRDSSTRCRQHAIDEGGDAGAVQLGRRAGVGIGHERLRAKPWRDRNSARLRHADSAGPCREFSLRLVPAASPSQGAAALRRCSMLASRLSSEMTSVIGKPHAAFVITAS